MGPIEMRLSFPHPLVYWYEVGILKVPALQLTDICVCLLEKRRQAGFICRSTFTIFIRTNSTRIKPPCKVDVECRGRDFPLGQQ